MTRYLLDTGPFTGYLKGARRAIRLVDPWIAQREVVTTMLSYGEVTEHFRSFPDADLRQMHLRGLLEAIPPLMLDDAIMERYADLRRLMRKPYGDGLIGDIDTLIAATALEHGLTVVTADTDFRDVPGLDVMMVSHKM